MSTVEQAPLSKAEAQSLTNRIRSLGEGIADRVDMLIQAVNEARDGDAHIAMGYRSWTEYVEREFTDVLPRLGREPRRELVATLADTGMSSRAIAPVVGVVESTVRADLAGARNHAPDQPITGRDGKTYAPRSPGAETRPREDHSAPGATDSDAPSPAPDADPIGDAKAAAKSAPARIGSAVMLDLEKAHGHIVRAGGPAAICADNDDLGAAFNPPLWADTLDRLIPLLTEWRRQLRRGNLRGVK